MNKDELDTLGASRAQALRKSMARSRLVFLQLGSAFEPVRDQLLGLLGAETIDASVMLSLHPQSQLVVVNNFEYFAHQSAQTTILGAAREKSMQWLDEGRQVCLVSRAPRMAFPRVPGSAILDDAAFVHPAPIQNGENAKWKAQSEASTLPLYHVMEGDRLPQCLAVTLPELGVDCLLAVDHALYEVDPVGIEGIRYLEAGVVEALRAAGLIVTDEMGVPTALVGGRDMVAWREGVATALDQSGQSSDAIGAISSGLWQIERSMRTAVRDTLRANDPRGWRESAVPGDLKEEVLTRARGDSGVAALKMRELRDPLEWLTLGELLDIIRSQRLGGLGVKPFVWSRFSSELLPIRNRVYHMRSVGRKEAETVAKWVVLVGRELADRPRRQE